MNAREQPSRPVRVYAFHKPRGVVVSRVSEAGARTVFELLPAPYCAWFAVGRLDKDSEGLVLFSDSSRFAQRLMDPGGLPKSYLVTVRGRPDENALAPMRAGGTAIAGRSARPVEVRHLGKAPRSGTRFEVVLHEGLNREIRRLFAAAGHKVRRLMRTAIGPLALGDLPAGSGRELLASEVGALSRALADNVV
jgi:23S rRNA pseudouridine2605 synthase